MNRTIQYREFEIYVELRATDQDLYDVSFQIKGNQNVAMIGERGIFIPLRNGPFTQRWAYLIAEVAGQAAIDALLSVSANDESAK